MGLWVFAAATAFAAESKLVLSSSGSVFQPWSGRTGYSTILSGQVALREGYYWIGIELEYRAFEANLGGGFGPDYESVLARGLFHFHPYPKWLVSPYVGLATGLTLNRADRRDRENGQSRSIRRRYSGGTTLLALAGVQARLPGSEHLSLFMEGRLETAGDLWKKRGANWQFDQVGGVTGTAGLRVRF